MDVHVLIADDNEDHRFLIRRALEGLAKREFAERRVVEREGARARDTAPLSAPPPLREARGDSADQPLSASPGADLGLNFHIRQARDGEEALALLKRSGEARPDFVLLDLKMPKKDGFEVLAAARRDPALLGLPIIVLSSSDNDRDVRRAYELGANAYLVKPMNGSEFMEKLRESARYWVRVVTLPPRDERQA